MFLFRSETPEKHAIKQFNIKLDITDETGTLIACNFRHEAVERCALKSDYYLIKYIPRTNFKWVNKLRIGQKNSLKTSHGLNFQMKLLKSIFEPM